MMHIIKDLEEGFKEVEGSLESVHFVWRDMYLVV